MNRREELIRQRAFEIWENSGRPDGVSDEHWLQAEKEINEELGNDVDAVPLMSGAAGEAGTTDQLPRWEGPPKNRPHGYLPAEDDPSTARDAAGENLQDPDRENLSDAFKTRKSRSK